MPEVIQFSRDGGLLIAGGGHHAKSGWVVLFDVKTGRPLSLVGNEPDTVLAADVDTTAGKLALGGPSRLLRVYEPSGNLLHEINKHNDWIRAVSFSPDGRYLASADRSGGIWLWEADTLRETGPLNGHTSAVHQLAWRGDSKVLVSAGDDGTLRFWNCDNAKQIRSVAAHEGAANAVCVGSDGRLVSGGRDRQVKLWSVDGKLQKSFGPMDDVVLATALSHDGMSVVAADWQGNVWCWNVETAERSFTLAPNPPTLEVRLATAKGALASAQAACTPVSERLQLLQSELKSAADQYDLALG